MACGLLHPKRTNRLEEKIANQPETGLIRGPVEIMHGILYRGNYGPQHRVRLCPPFHFYFIRRG